MQLEEVPEQVAQPRSQGTQANREKKEPGTQAQRVLPEGREYPARQTVQTVGELQVWHPTGQVRQLLPEAYRLGAHWHRPGGVMGAKYTEQAVQRAALEQVLQLKGQAVQAVVPKYPGAQVQALLLSRKKDLHYWQSLLLVQVLQPATQAEQVTGL